MEVRYALKTVLISFILIHLVKILLLVLIKVVNTKCTWMDFVIGALKEMKRLQKSEGGQVFWDLTSKVQVSQPPLYVCGNNVAIVSYMLLRGKTRHLFGHFRLKVTI